MTNIAIIGAGISGLCVANGLSKEKSTAVIDIFEKSRGVGGRLATRRCAEIKFDHGAPFFTARDKQFRRWVNQLLEQGVVAPWQPKLMTLNPNTKPFKRQWFEPHYIGLGGNNTLGKYLAGGQHIVFNGGIHRCVKLKDQWFLTDIHNNQYGPYDWLVAALPPAQLTNLFLSSAESVELPVAVTNIKMTSCFVMMLSYEYALPVTWEWAKVNESSIASISLEYAKQGRAGFGVVVKSTESWAEQHRDVDINLVQERLLTEFNRLLAGQIGRLKHDSTWPRLVSIACHRWLYSQKFINEADDSSGKIDDAFYCDDKNQFSCCGDWFLSGDVESAYLSADSLVQDLNRRLKMFHNG